MQTERDAERDKVKADALPLVCPVCNFFFISWEVKSFGYETRRTDFRPNYIDENPMGLFYHMCQKCRFCADQEYFSLELHWEKRRVLEDGCARLFREHGKNLKSSIAAKLHYGALVGDLLQSLGLISETVHDRTQSFVQAFWWSEPDEMARYGEVALNRLKETAGLIENDPEDYIYTLYMIGEVSRRLGKTQDADLYFEKVESLCPTHQNDSNRFLFDLARQQRTDPKDIMPEESLNPYNK